MSWWLQRQASGVAVAPSLLSADFSRLGEEVRSVEKAGADLLHLDVMDGHFVPNITFGPLVVEAVRKVTNLKLVAHLMIEKPERLMESFARAGADVVTIHAEASADLGADLERIRAAGAMAGVALNPDTQLHQIEDHLGRLDLLLVMSVYPGFPGQEFIESVLDKLRSARALREELGYGFALEIDGGINGKTAPLARKAGADILVAGTAVFRSADYTEAIAALRG